MGRIQGADPGVGDEFQHHPQPARVAGLAQGGEVGQHAAMVRVIADGQHVPRAQLDRQIERGEEGGNVGMGHQPDRLDIEDRDARVRHSLLHCADGAGLAGNGHDHVPGDRRHDAEPDRVEPAGRGGIDQFDRACVHDGQMSQREAAHRPSASAGTRGGQRAPYRVRSPIAGAESEEARHLGNLVLHQLRARLGKAARFAGARDPGRDRRTRRSPHPRWCRVAARRGRSARGRPASCRRGWR